MGRMIMVSGWEGRRRRMWIGCDVDEMIDVWVNVGDGCG